MLHGMHGALGGTMGRYQGVILSIQQQHGEACLSPYLLSSVRSWVVSMGFETCPHAMMALCLSIMGLSMPTGGLTGRLCV